MKNKLFSILIVVNLIGMALVSQAAPLRELAKPIPATDVQVFKKLSLPLTVGETKGKPEIPPGQDKEKNKGQEKKAATGILGEKVTGNKYAVLIGICNYPGDKNDICDSDGDSYNMREALIKNYGYLSDNIKWFRDMGGTLPEGNYEIPSWANISNAVAGIKSNATSGSEIVFFFSGHGANGIAQDTDSERKDEAIVVHDGTNLEYIWDGELRGWFSTFDTSRIVFIFDSCLAGGMNDVADNGRVVSMGTGENQSAYVYSYGEYGEGVFSHYFVNEGMLQGLGDRYDHDQDGALLEKDDVVVEEAFDYAKENIPKFFQTPVISDFFINDLLL